MTLQPPRHVTTPMGSWNFFRDQLPPGGAQQHTGAWRFTDDTTPDGITITRLSPEQYAAELFMPDEDAHLQGHNEHRSAALLITVTATVLQPLIIVHSADHAVYRNTIIKLAAGAECSIIEQFNDAAFVSHVTELLIAENAHLHYAQLQQGSETLISRKRARLARDATLHLFELNDTRGRLYSRSQAILAAEDADARMHSVFLGEGNDALDIGMEATHDAAQTNSDLVTKGTLQDKSAAVYEGVLTINDAPKSNAFQKEDCMLFGKDTNIKASPMLYINNNDVRCSHAATASRIDADKRFYLTSRGLPPNEADRLLTRAFLWPVLERLEGPARNHLMGLVAQRIGGHHE